MIAAATQRGEISMLAQSPRGRTARSPTGSGKSTTLAALIDLVDQRRAAYVITLEDPIEYRFTSRRGGVHQREVGRHIASFAAGLRSALREAPDVPACSRGQQDRRTARPASAWYSPVRAD